MGSPAMTLSQICHAGRYCPFRDCHVRCHVRRHVSFLTLSQICHVPVTTARECDVTDTPPLKGCHVTPTGPALAPLTGAPSDVNWTAGLGIDVEGAATHTRVFPRLRNPSPPGPLCPILPGLSGARLLAQNFGGTSR